MAIHKDKIPKIITAVLAVILAVSIGLYVFFLVCPPDSESCEKSFDSDRSHLKRISYYLTKNGYVTATISESDYGLDTVTISDGVKAVKVDGEVINISCDGEEIKDKNILKSLGYLFVLKDYDVISKNGDTIYFEKWSFGNQQRGISLLLDETKGFNIQYVVETVPLAEKGWYYYRSDYEEWRNLS